MEWNNAKNSNFEQTQDEDENLIPYTCPKSANLRTPSSEINKLQGFKSLWTIMFLWHASTPLRTCIIHLFTSPTLPTFPFESPASLITLPRSLLRYSSTITASSSSRQKNSCITTTFFDPCRTLNASISLNADRWSCTSFSATVAPSESRRPRYTSA